MRTGNAKKCSLLQSLYLSVLFNYFVFITIDFQVTSSFTYTPHVFSLSRYHGSHSSYRVIRLLLESHWVSHPCSRRRQSWTSRTIPCLKFRTSSWQTGISSSVSSSYSERSSNSLLSSTYRLVKRDANFVIHDRSNVVCWVCPTLTISHELEAMTLSSAEVRRHQRPWRFWRNVRNATVRLWRRRRRLTLWGWGMISGLVSLSGWIGSTSGLACSFRLHLYCLTLSTGWFFLGSMLIFRFLRRYDLLFIQFVILRTLFFDIPIKQTLETDCCIMPR